MRDDLYRLGYYILGNSAYAIESFLLPPYDNATSRISKDDFNCIIPVHASQWNAPLQRLIYGGEYFGKD